MQLTTLPLAASWTHQSARSGFEVAFFAELGTGYRLCGHTTADESAALWSVGYDVTVYDAWNTMGVRVSSLSTEGTRASTLNRDGADRWIVDGEPRPELDGCVDVAFESSAVTNTLPLHRIDFVRGVSVEVPAAFVRVNDLRVERLEQRYTLTHASPLRLVFRNESSTFNFACDLEYDSAGLVEEYPGIAVRKS